MVLENEFGQLLREIRKSKNITMNELSERSGITQANISMFETGRRKPNYKSLSKLSKGLEISLVELLQLAGYIVEEDFNTEITKTLELREEIHNLRNENKRLEESLYLIRDMLNRVLDVKR